MTLKMVCGMSNEKQQVWSSSFSPAKATVINVDEVEIVLYKEDKLDRILQYILRSDNAVLMFLKNNPVFAYISCDDDIVPAELSLSQDEKNDVATL